MAKRIPVCVAGGLLGGGADAIIVDCAVDVCVRPVPERHGENTARPD
jgi:hypothetical protein